MHVDQNLLLHYDDTYGLTFSEKKSLDGFLFIYFIVEDVYVQFDHCSGQAYNHNPIHMTSDTSIELHKCNHQLLYVK